MKVLTYNIWDGGAERLPLIEQVIRSQAPDVVALEEVTDRAGTKALARRLSMEYVHGEANSEWAVAWLTALPLERAENHRLPELAKTLLEIEVSGLRLFATHLVHGRDEASEDVRVREVEAILRVLAQVDGPHLLVGDLNAMHPEDEVGEPPPEEQLAHVARRPIVRLLDADYIDPYRALHPAERGWTYLTRHPFARLDYVLSKGLDVRECAVVTSGPAREASDHFPVAALVG